MAERVRGLVIAGATSGAGKTTVATGIIGALVRRGLRVQPFKVGPDYIDPSYHSQVAGRACRNLDTWMLPHDVVAELFDRACSGADIAVVEGVMGLYDGHSATGDAGSTAELAKVLNLPVVLVVDASGAARSLAALVLGYKSFDPELQLAGVIFNGIGSDRHYQMCREAVTGITDTAVMGYLPKKKDMTLPERHLGLVPMAEGPTAHDFFERLIDQVETTLDMDRLLVIAAQADSPKTVSGIFPQETQPKRVRLAVARDKAFSFYYQDCLDLLEAWGAELRPFSPLADTSLPEGIDGIYIGGGFPEMYARELAQNTPMLSAVRQAARAGMPVYAECGGLMYLGQFLRDFDGVEHRMAEVLPVASCLDDTKLSLGYRTIRALSDGPILKQGQEVRGHEFHWSRLDREPQGEAAYLIPEQDRREGFLMGNALASYVHVHFASRVGLAQQLIESCKQRSNRRNAIA